ncbi:MAG: hypothetical protein GY798_27135 [Hyphomicrobiales bacterium]|nr:hypothetical protein [Hyphomicrobiales bacterium]
MERNPSGLRHGMRALVGAVFLLPATALSQDSDCMNNLAGTYLLSITKDDGSFASRAIMSIDDNGNLLIADSNQLPFKFGLQMGVLHCVGGSDAEAVTLDFGMTESDGAADLARSDWRLTATEDKIAGEISVVLYQPLETCDPMAAPEACDADPMGTFAFAGSRLAPASK